MMIDYLGIILETNDGYEISRHLVDITKSSTLVHFLHISTIARFLSFFWDLLAFPAFLDLERECVFVQNNQIRCHRKTHSKFRYTVENGWCKDKRWKTFVEFVAFRSCLITLIFNFFSCHKLSDSIFPSKHERVHESEMNATKGLHPRYILINNLSHSTSCNKLVQALKQETHSWNFQIHNQRKAHRIKFIRANIIRIYRITKQCYLYSKLISDSSASRMDAEVSIDPLQLSLSEQQ